MCVREFKAYLRRRQSVGDRIDKRFVDPVLDDRELDDSADLDGLIAHLENLNAGPKVIADARHLWTQYERDKQEEIA